MICEAAYLVSSKRSPFSAHPEQDWAQAETVIDLFFEVG